MGSRPLLDVASAVMAGRGAFEEPDNDLLHEIRQVRWYLGFLCLIAAVGVVLVALVAFGVLDVSVTASR